MSIRRPVAAVLFGLIVTGLTVGCDGGGKPFGPGSAIPGATVTYTNVVLPLAQRAQLILSPSIVCHVFTLEAASGFAVDVTGISIDNTGSVDETIIVPGTAQLYIDVNTNGFLDGPDTFEASAPIPVSDDEPYIFGALTQIPAGTIVQYLVVVDGSGTPGLPDAAHVGVTLSLGVAQGTDIASAGTSAGTFGSNTPVNLGIHPHLLLSEVVYDNDPRTGPTTAGVEYIEIYNPTPGNISLGTYYLSDFSDTPSKGEGYWMLPSGSKFGPDGAATTTFDFTVRFPAAAFIAPNQIRIVAVKGQDFVDRYAFSADYCLTQKGASLSAYMGVWDGVVPPTGYLNFVQGELGATGNNLLSDTNEHVVIFQYSTALNLDLVTDVDQVAHGPASPTNENQTKNVEGVDATLNTADDVKVDGPDNGAVNQADTSTFAPELTWAAMDPLRRDPNGTRGIRRTDYTEGGEVSAAGNNIAGHQETSENFLLTWEEVAAGNPPNPGVP